MEIDDDTRPNQPRDGEPTRSLSNLDLNMLVTLDAVLQHQSVTRAAEQLGITQPAVSATLRRLRRHFADELLYRAGARYRLTALAADLRPRTRVALEGVERVFNSRSGLDVGDTIREFAILTSDYATSLIGEAVVRNLLDKAPHARIRIIPTSPELVVRAEQVLTERDLLLVPHGFVYDLPNEELFRDEWAIVMDADNPIAATGPTVDDLKTLPWVLVYHDAAASTPAARQLRMLGIEPRAQVVTESFLTVPALLAHSDRISLLPTLMLEAIPEEHNLIAHPPPVPLEPLVQAMWWHPIHDREPEHQLLRDVVRSAVGDVIGGS
ncbi:LysR family transcriptional regulator [Gordonia sp. PKS22-38]|uniref:LysR family transcriptional regulator n=1 Tax=Gordonia prachuapensis TaxID=3115651 RepID=A0ABU7MTF4_9ACTN|nr:LysR family transcriptional regulator [Gordonia sp. PKS22-38]